MVGDGVGRCLLCYFAGLMICLRIMRDAQLLSRQRGRETSSGETMLVIVGKTNDDSFGEFYFVSVKFEWSVYDALLHTADLHINK